MLGMGLTLEVADFARVAQAPFTVATGLVLQYTVMPALGWAMGYAFELRRRSPWDSSWWRAVPGAPHRTW